VCVAATCVWQLPVSALFTLRHHQTPVTIKCREKTSNAKALEVKTTAEISTLHSRIQNWLSQVTTITNILGSRTRPQKFKVGFKYSSELTINTAQICMCVGKLENNK